MNKIRLLIVDDHAIYRMGLIALLDTEPDIEVVGEADDGAAAVRAALKTRPDVVLMDIMMPKQDGIAATRELHEKLPSANILILTTSTTSDDLNGAIENGALGVMSKSAENAKLLAAIRAVAAGKPSVSAEIRRLIAEDPPAPALTQRQREILQSLARGLSNPEIATQFHIGTESVKDHLNALYSKLGAANRSEAVAIALRKHLLKA